MTAHEVPAMDEPEQHVWVPEDGVPDPDADMLTGSEDEFLAAIKRGEVWSVEYDEITGLYCWVEWDM
jgi:hypothetical protein